MIGRTAHDRASLVRPSRRDACRRPRREPGRHCGRDGPSAAAAAPVSQATGRFLSGQLGTTSLDTLVALNGESAVNTGGATVTKQHSLSASLLGQQLLNLPNGVQLPGGDVLTLGAVNQYAQANPNGSAQGASGAITNSGAIGFGNGGAPQSDATLVLGDLSAIPGINVAGVPSIGKITASIARSRRPPGRPRVRTAPRPATTSWPA